RSSLSATIGGTKDFLNSYSYDTLSRLVTMQQVDQNGGNVVASKEVAYAYNAIGDVTARSAYNFVGVGPRYDIATSAISYNTLGQLTGISMTSDVGQVTLDNLSYSYDTLGRVSTLGSIDGTAAYGYDKTSQLTSASYVAASGHVEPPNFTVTFDPNGTRTSANGVSTTVGADNHLTNDGTFTFAYDPAGNLTTRTRISSAAANDYKTVYLWDYRNRLTDVEFYNNSGTLTQHVHYVYDVWNNLIERDLDPSGSGTYTQIVHYVWDSPESQGAGGIVLAFNGADQLIARYLNGPNTSAYDQYYSTLVEEDVTSTSQGGTLTFPQLDQQGSVIDIADNNGNLADHIVYFSTGGVYTESHPSVPHLAGFQGGYIDVVTGMEKFGARWLYVPDAFWAGQDPDGFAAGDANLTRFVGNSATNFVDPSGLAGRKATKEDGANAKEELAAAGVSDEEARLRMKALSNAWRGKVGFGDNRNADFWEEVGEENNRYYVPKDGVKPSDAINDLWNSRNRIQCYKYSALIIIKAKLDRANEAERERLDEMMAGKEIPQGLPNGGEGTFFDDEWRDEGPGFDEHDLLPGDQVWFENPYYNELTPKELEDDEDVGRYTGEQGSNVFYIGGGKVMAIYRDYDRESDSYTHKVYTIDEYRQRVQGFSCVQDKGPNATVGEFQIRRVRRPIVSEEGEGDE
ncbi:MAG TPA: hypothetical protein VF278_12950, partial [Pirellulales bacterium]